MLHLDQLSKWVSHLPIIVFHYKFATNDASTHFLLFEVSYQHQSATLLDRLLKVIGTPGLVADHLSKLACVWNVVSESLTLSKQCMGFSFFSSSLYLFPCDLGFLSSKVYKYTRVMSFFSHFMSLKKLAWNYGLQSITSLMV